MHHFKDSTTKSKRFGKEEQASLPADNGLHPAFCFKFNTPKHYRVEDLEKPEKAAFMNKIYTLSRMTWGEIQSSSKENMGHEIINDLKEKLPTEVTLTPDENILVFRLPGKSGRFAGYRRRKIFYVVWVDTSFKLYKH